MIEFVTANRMIIRYYAFGRYISIASKTCIMDNLNFEVFDQQLSLDKSRKQSNSNDPFLPFKRRETMMMHATMSILDFFNTIGESLAPFDSGMIESTIEQELIATETETPNMDLLTCTSALTLTNGSRNVGGRRNKVEAKSGTWTCTGKCDPTIGLGPLADLFNVVTQESITGSNDSSLKSQFVASTLAEQYSHFNEFDKTRAEIENKTNTFVTQNDVAAEHVDYNCHNNLIGYNDAACEQTANKLPMSYVPCMFGEEPNQENKLQYIEQESLATYKNASYEYNMCNGNMHPHHLASSQTTSPLVPVNCCETIYHGYEPAETISYLTTLGGESTSQEPIYSSDEWYMPSEAQATADHNLMTKCSINNMVNNNAYTMPNYNQYSQINFHQDAYY